MSTAAPSRPTRHKNLYAHHIWKQWRFFGIAFIVIGGAATGLAVYQHQFNSPGFALWLIYIPSGLAIAVGSYLYARRSNLQVLEGGVKISNMFSSVLIDYDSIRSVKALPLRQHFQDRRSKMIAPIMKQHIDEAAVFIRVRGDDAELAEIKKHLGLFKTRLMDEETIAIPGPDANKAVWEISAHLPERLGQNQGGAKRRKHRR